jgi:hypothetical protein
MRARDRHIRSASEQLISALLPDVQTPRLAARPVSLPSLPVLTPSQSSGPNHLILGTARVDRSERFHERALLRVLGWGPGQELRVDASRGAIVITATPGEAHHVDDRGAIALPTAARRMCGIPTGPPVVLLADIARQVVVVLPAATATRVLAAHSAALIGGSNED